MKKLLQRCFALLLASGMMLALASCGTESQQPVTAPSEQQSSRVKTDTATKADIMFETKVQAMMIPTATENLYFDGVSGPLASIGVSLYDSVSEGQEIASIDPVELEAQLATLEIENRIWEVDVKHQELQKTSYRFSVDRAQSNYNYALDLYNGSATAENKDYLDQAKHNLDIAKLNRESFNLNHEIFEIRHEAFKEQYEETKKLRDNCTITSPTDGIVTYVTTLAVEERITAGTHVARVVPYSSMALRITNISGVSFQGQTEVNINYDGTDYAAFVYTPEPGDIIYQKEGASALSYTYFRFYTDVPTAVMELALPVSISVDKRMALTINKRCLQNVNGVVTVNVVLEDGNHENRIVTCGLDDGDRIEILDGLTEGEQVIIY